MKLYVIGAGASAGSTESASLKSPVANDLFQEGYYPYAEIVGISESEFRNLRESARDNGNLEEYLTAEWEAIESLGSEQSKNAERVRFGRITLYIYWLFQTLSFDTPKSNAYLDFTELLRAKQEDFSIINFNYDTLLDTALVKTFGYPLHSSLSNYYLNNYLKPHGSVNWFIDPHTSSEQWHDSAVMLSHVTNSIYSAQSTTQTFVIQPPNLAALNTIEYLRQGPFHPYAMPLVFIPLTTKLYTLYTSLYEEIIARANVMCETVDEVIVIGYQARDNIIKELLAKITKGTPLSVYSRSSSEAIANSLCGAQMVPQLTKNSVQDIDFTNYIKIERSKL